MTKELIIRLFDLLLTQGSMAMGAALSLFSAGLWLVSGPLGIDGGTMAFTWMFVSVVFLAGMFTAQRAYQKVREELLGTV
jgi:hypothetical protein